METRQIYEIMMIKCEYVNEFESVLQQILQNCNGITQKIEQAYTLAKSKRLLPETPDPAQLAKDTNLFFIGLLHMWVKDIHNQQFRQEAQALIQFHMRLRRFQKMN